MEEVGTSRPIEDAAAVDHRIALQRILDLEHTLSQRDRLIAEQKAKLQLSKQKVLDLGAAVQTLKGRIVPPSSGEPSDHPIAGKSPHGGGGSFGARSCFATSSLVAVQTCDASCATDNTEWVLTQLAAKLSSTHEATIVTLKTQLQENEETIRLLRRERDDAVQVATHLRDAQRRRHQWLLDCLKHTSDSHAAQASLPSESRGDGLLWGWPVDSEAVKHSTGGDHRAPIDAVNALQLERESMESILQLPLSDLAAVVGRVVGSNPQHTAILAERIRRLGQEWAAARRTATSSSPASGPQASVHVRHAESTLVASESPSPRHTFFPELREVPNGPVAPSLVEGIDGGRSLLENLALETSMPMTAGHVVPVAHAITMETRNGARGALQPWEVSYGLVDNPSAGAAAPPRLPHWRNVDGDREDEHPSSGLGEVVLRSLEMRLEVLRRAEAQPLPDTLRHGVAAEITEIEQRLESHASATAAALRSAALSYRRSVARHAPSDGGDVMTKRTKVGASPEAFRMRSPSNEGDTT